MAGRLRHAKIIIGAAAALAAGWATAPALAQAAEAADPIAGLVAEAQTAAPPLWRVTDADSTYWLFGTFHILPPSLEWRTAALEQAIENADRFYFEVEGDSPDAQSRTLQVLMLKGFNPPGETLSGMLDEADAQALRTIVADLSLPIAAIDPMRPWQAFLALSVQFIVDQGFTPGAGADAALMAEARGRGKELKFFETVEQQLGFFTGLSKKTEKDLLVLTLRNWDEQTAEFDKLFAAWRDGDVEVIDRAMNEDLRDEAPEVFTALIVNRNKAWADVIAADMRGGAGEALVAVGAAHMAGDEFSLPALLAAKGFTVERYNGAPLSAAPEAANDNEPVDEGEEAAPEE